MAENVLQCPRQSNSPEEVGELYFDDLLSRSFFQQSSSFDDFFVMHDLLNDLAKYVCGDICFRWGVDKAERIRNTTRHFSFNTYYTKYFDDVGSLSNAKRLRMFIRTNIGPLFWKGVISVHELCFKFKFLHNLSLSGCSSLIEVPESIGEFKYLCSLDLSDTGIKRLPDSTCSLYNLQTLKLNLCSNLEEFPSDLHKLVNLRCLEFSGSEVRRMPVHLEKLKNLQVLSRFCVGKNSESGIQQLRGLNLHGELSIEELQNTVNPMDASAVDLKNKTRLVKLALVWKSNHIPDDPRKDREVLEYLQPSNYLKHLSIYNYGGTEFPSWLSDNSFLNVVSLTLGNCKYCLVLPPFGVLQCLKELRIEGLDGIVNIGGADFYGTSSSPFPSLEILHFGYMKEWEEWECEVSFPRLQSLCICEPKLKEVSEQLLHIKNLRIEKCGSIEARRVERNGHAVSNTSLEELFIDGCPNIDIPKRSYCDSLLQLSICNGSCDSLTTFPLDLFPKLNRLELWSCRNLGMITQEHTHNHLEDVGIGSCPKLESIPNEGGLLSNLKSLTLIDMSMKLIGSLKGALGPNSCLRSLTISCVEVECFPEEGLLPLFLTDLSIINSPNMKKLDYKGLCNLSSLKELRLYYCPNLECLPEEGLPKSVSTLYILDCPLLKQRCQKPEGEDWPKIANIQNHSIL